LKLNVALPHNKRMQTDQTTRYAPGLAADAGRYAISLFDESMSMVAVGNTHHNNQSSQQISFREELCLKARD
jgi:hypothetical protein